MTFQKGTNEYRIDGDVVFIDVSTKKYPRAEAVIDLADLPLVIDGNGRWAARCSDRIVYVSRRRHRKHVALHRHLLLARRLSAHHYRSQRS